MDELSDDLEKLYCQFGRTAEQAQLMELEAGNLAIAYVSLIFDRSKVIEEDRRFFLAIIEDVNRRTLGNLLKNIRKIGTVSDDIENILDDALEKRNHLIHKFFRTHNFAINSAEGRKEIIRELDDIFKALSKANAVLSGMTHTFNEVFGLPNISQEQALALLQKGKRVEI